MPRVHKPRSGSMAYSPRKRARRIYPRVHSWPESEEAKLLGFAGYKAGMTHMFVLDDRKDTATSKQEVFTPVTILECPPITPFIIRSYRITPYGKKLTGELWAETLSKSLSLKTKLPQKTPSTLSENADLITVVVHTEPEEAKIGKKKPEVFECAVGGKNVEEQLAYAKGILGKELKASELFKGGDFVDVASVTKGKGVQGPVVRFGVKIQNKKAIKSGKGRHVGSLGNRSHPTRWTVPMAGQHGYHTRTEFNKRIVQIGANGAEVTPKGGFVNYGVVKNEFIAIKGSVPGPVKRLIRIRPSLRDYPKLEEPQVTYTSVESKQSR